MSRSATAIAAALALAALCEGSPPPGLERSFASPCLPRPAVYSVFLPPDYFSTSRSYPVLYFLHDGFGDHRVLSRHGVTERLASAMKAGSLPEFLVVSPEGRRSWFSNFHDGSSRYEDLVAEDLRREVERRFRVLPGRENRGITGISMGGYGAVKIALHHPDEYGSVSSLSGAIIPMGWEDIRVMFFLARRQLHRVFGSSPADNSLAENDVWKIVQAGGDWHDPFDVFLLAGTQDKYHLDHVAAQYADFLNRHGIRAAARLEPGTHDWPFWSKAFLEIAAWHGAKFLSAEH
ncbi:MAG: alpha/beta hydrolase [Thermoanaerobaculia bacterium]